MEKHNSNLLKFPASFILSLSLKENSKKFNKLIFDKVFFVMTSFYWQKSHHI